MASQVDGMKRVISEVSQFIVVKDEELHIKMVVGSPMYFPKAAILDPLLLRGLSFWQSVVNGIHALSHAIEAYFTTMATPIKDAWALQAVSTLCCLIGVGFDPFYCLTRGPPKGFDLFSN
jgi:alcohol dehydrogenase class IV